MPVVCHGHLKRLVDLCDSLPIPQTLAGDAGIEPALSRLRGECISHFCQSPRFNIKMAQDVGSKQNLAFIDRGLDLRANSACSTTSLRSFAQSKLWCAVRELKPHLLGVGQLFWSVERTARKIGREYRSRTCLAALIWRRSGYKPLPLAAGPSIGGSRWIRTIRDGVMRAAFFLLNQRALFTLQKLAGRAGFEPAHCVSNSHVPFHLGYRPRNIPKNQKGPGLSESSRN
jgi:hypothetical protein